MSSSSTSLEKIETDLHSAIDIDQIIVVELENVRHRIERLDPEAAAWLNKIEKRLLQQGELVYDARKELREIGSLDDMFSRLRSGGQNDSNGNNDDGR